MKMKKIFIFSILASVAILSQAQSMKVDNVTLNAGSETTLLVSVATMEENNYVGTGMVLQLAEGFTIVSDDAGLYANTDSGVADDHVTRASLNSNSRLKVAVYSPTNSKLDLVYNSTPSTGGEGDSGGSSGGRAAPRKAPGEEESDIVEYKDLCTIKIVAPNASGSYLCQLTNVEYATSDYELVTMPNASFTITVKQSGDVNNDGSITIADVTELVNIILGKNLPANQGMADINGDGSVTIADVTALVNIILGKTGQ